MTVAVYERVSTTQQDLLAHLVTINDRAKRDGLKPLAKDLYLDVGSGARANRPALLRLRAEIRAHRVKSVVTTRLDRLGRSLIDVVGFFEEAHANGVRVVLTEQSEINIDGSSGRLILHVLAAAAEFERSLLRERIAETNRIRREKGERLGRKRTFEFDDARARALRGEGKGWGTICTELGIPKTATSAVRRACKGLSKTPPENGPVAPLSEPEGPTAGD